MTHYVVGFYFNETMERVTLIKKNKPEWQKGLLNGLGGKIEFGETSAEAMRREFKEECGVDVSYWREVGAMLGEDWTCCVLYAVEPNEDKFLSSDSLEEEEVGIYEVDSMPEFDTVSNLQWLIPLCIDMGLYENTEYSAVIAFKKLNSEPNVQECDATDDDSSTSDGPINQFENETIQKKTSSN